VFKKSLTGPTLLEMSGKRVNQGLRLIRLVISAGRTRMRDYKEHATVSFRMHEQRASERQVPDGQVFGRFG